MRKVAPRDVVALAVVYAQHYLVSPGRKPLRNQIAVRGRQALLGPFEPLAVNPHGTLPQDPFERQFEGFSLHAARHIELPFIERRPDERMFPGQTLDLLAAYRRFKHVRFSEAGEISGPWQLHGLEASQAVETDLPDARQIHTVLLSAGNEAESQDDGHEAYSLLHGRKGIKSRANISFSGERKVFSKNLQ